MERIEKPKDVRVPFETLENLDYRLRWVMGGLGLEKAERNELEEVEEIFWDILNPQGGRCLSNLVRMPLEALEGARKILD